jgi:uncharacterized SAM-binding protein YcdF (DUF218 family)
MNGDEPRGRLAGRVMLRTGRRAIAIVLIIAAPWTAGLVWFAETIPRADRTSIPDTPTDAVVVLTGGPLRVQAGLAVLEAGRARKLLVSGVHPSVEMTELLRSAQRPTTGGPAAGVECCVVLGYDADNTAGNAAETRRWMEREGYRSLRLVTASYHMPRSLLEFRRALPGMTIVPHPVFPEGFKRESWWTWPGTLALVVSEYHKYLAAAARDWVVRETGTVS